MPGSKSNSPAPLDKDRLRWEVPLLAAVFTFIVFLPALNNGFVDWDDDKNFLNNYLYRGLGLEQLKWMFTTTGMGTYAPLTCMTFGLDYLIWGMDPFGYHFTSVLLHSVNAFVFCMLCIKLFALAAGPGHRKSDLYLSAGFAALFFSIHPLRVESAVWLSDRIDVLSGTFYMSAMLLYISPRSGAGPAYSLWRRHLLPLAVFLLALFSKGIAISLPIALVLLDIYPLRRLPLDPKRWFSPEFRAVWLEKIPFFIISVLFGLAGYRAQINAGKILSLQVFGFGQRAAQVLFAAGFYIWKTLAPLNLAPLYELKAGLLSRQSLLGGILLFAITAGAIKYRRRWPAIPVVWIYYLAVLAPVSGILKIGSQAAADRYTYLPCLGFAALAGAALWKSRQASGAMVRNLGVAIACSTIAIFSLLSRQQIGIWHDSESLWRHTLAVNPGLEIAHYNFGVEMAARGSTAEAVEHWRTALLLNPDYSEAHNNFGAALAAQGRVDEAITHYREALRLNPSQVEAYNNLGAALAARGGFEEAVAYYRTALRLDPGYSGAHNNLGVSLAALGRPGEAIAEYETSLRLNPAQANAHFNFGAALAAQGRLDEAIEHYRAALRFYPSHTDAHNNLGIALAAQGKSDEAIAHWLAALRLNPAYTGLHYNLGVALAAQGRLDEAIAHYRAALRLNPAQADAHYNLGVALAAQGRLDEAITHYRAALRLDPAYADAHNNLGVALVARGRLDEAIAHYRAALRLAPGHVNAHYNFGTALAMQGKADEAITQYQTALRLNPDATYIRHNLDVVMKQRPASMK